MLQVYLENTSNILQVTSSILHPVELKKNKYTSRLCYFDKGSTFEEHFVKLNQYFK